jgi:hypothetical protein
MHPSIAHHLNRLVDRLAHLRVRLRAAARLEVAEAISESLAEATRRLLGAPARQRPRSYPGEPYWEDAWEEPSEDDPYDEEISWSQPHHEPHAAGPLENAEPSRVATALMTAVRVARWSYCRTGQPLPALVFAALAAGAVLLFGDDALLLPKVCSTLQELLPRPEAED